MISQRRRQRVLRAVYLLTAWEVSTTPAEGRTYGRAYNRAVEGMSRDDRRLVENLAGVQMAAWNVAGH